jgi:HJR/Mrr/RecB family endonuclease
MLFMAVLAVIALLWQWAAVHPLMALFAIPSMLAVLYLIGLQVQAQEMAELDAKTRDAHVPSMSPTEYERFVARLLKRAGWSVQHIGRTGDQGCDVLAEIRGFRAVVQVTKARAGNAKVQQVVGARQHYGAQIMVVVALGFTPSARQLAASNGVHLMFHGELSSLQQRARIP